MKIMTERISLLPFEWPGSYYIAEEEIENVNKVLLARSPFRYYGHDVQHFVDGVEARYRERLGRRYALAVNSGTAALSVALSAMGVGPGDEVLLPGYLWVSCIASIVRAGAIPRLVDIDATFCMDPDDLAQKIGPHSKAVLIVHMNGSSGRLDDLLKVARDHNLRVLEDVAQGNGGSYKGRPLGSFGDMATFSFQLNKHITSGEGGMVVTDDESLYRRAWACHDMGYPRDDNGRLVQDNPETQLWGQGSRMSELTAAMLAAQIDKLDTIVANMRRQANRLYAGLQDIAGLQLRYRPDPDGDTGASVLMIWPDAATCQRMVETTRAAGVCTPSGGNNARIDPNWGLHVYYYNRSLVERRSLTSVGRPWSDPLNTFAADYRYDKGSLPQADDLFSRSNVIMLTPTWTDDLTGQVIAIFRQQA